MGQLTAIRVIYNRVSHHSASFIIFTVVLVDIAAVVVVVMEVMLVVVVIVTVLESPCLQICDNFITSGFCFCFLFCANMNRFVHCLAHIRAYTLKFTKSYNEWMR